MSSSIRRRSNVATLAAVAALACSLSPLPRLRRRPRWAALPGSCATLRVLLVPGASVVVINTQTGAKRRTLTTDSEGHYLATFLQPGVYEVIVGGGSFGKVDQKNVNVQVGDTRTVDADLPAASVTTDIIVTDTELAAAGYGEGGVVADGGSEELVSNLPVNSRRFDSFVLAYAERGAGRQHGSDQRSAGISGIYNSNFVDGANNNQAFFSEARGRSIGAPYVYPVDLRSRSFRANLPHIQRSLARQRAALSTQMTKSGGNRFHGDVYEYYRTPGYNAIDRQTKAKPVKVQHQFGVSVGGPIIKDKLFFHAVYDGYRKVTPITYLSTYNTATQSVNDLTALCDRRTSGYLARGAAVYPSVITNISPAQCTAAVAFLTGTQLGTYPRNVTQDVYFPRLDYQLNSKTHLSASFLFENFKQPNGYNTSTTQNNGGISQNGTASFHERFLVVNAESVLTARSANVVHFQWSRDLETATTNTGGPALSITGLAAYGETSALPRGAFPDEHRWQITDIYSTTLGKHSIKIGGDLNLIHEQIQNLFQGNGQFSYGTGTTEFNFANWIQDVYQVNGGRHYNNFTQVNDPITGNGADDFWNKNIDGFVEDAWKVSPRLLLSLGVRYDVQLVPQPERPNTSSAVAQLYTSTINNYNKMIQPRIGFAFTPHEGTVVRGGYGIFYGLNSNSTYYTQRRENGVYQQQFNVSALTNPNSPYVTVAAPAGSPNRAFQQSGAYAANAPQGGIPEFTPPGPAPINQVTGAATPAVSTNLSAGSISARGLDPNFQNPSSMSYDLTVEQQMPLHSTLTVAYVGNRGLRLPIFVDTNVDPNSARTNNYYFYSAPGATPIIIPVPYYTARLSPNTGAVLTGFSDVNSNYNSLVFTVRKPFSNGVEILANYTWAKAMDGGQVSGVNGTFNGTDTPIDPFARGHRLGRSAEYALSDLNIKGRFVGSIVAAPKVDRVIDNRYVRYALNGFQVSGTLTAQTGQPLTGFLANSPVSLIGDGGLSGAALSLFNSGTPGRVPTVLAPRNGFKGPGVHGIDARVSRTFPIHETFRLELFAEAFNVANHKNILAVNTSLYSYLTPTGATSASPVGTITCPTTAGAGCIAPIPASSAQFGTTSSTSSVLYGARQVQLTAKLYF